MNDTEHPQDAAWYQNGMLWLVIAIPALTVAGCLLTILLAISHPETIVSDYRLRTDTGIARD